MTKRNQFSLQNDTSGSIVVNIEPESFHYPLAAGEKVTVRETYSRDPLTLKIERDGGDTIISVWPGDGDVCVESEGSNVMDRPQIVVGHGVKQ